MMLNRKGLSIIEYAVLIVMVLSALFIFKDQIKRAFFGRYKSAGDSFAYGRQYEGPRTLDCAHRTIDSADVWYDQSCYEHKQAEANNCPSGNAQACEDANVSACQKTFAACNP